MLLQLGLQPEDNANTLAAIYDKFAKLADDHSGILPTSRVI